MDLKELQDRLSQIEQLGIDFPKILPLAGWTCEKYSEVLRDAISWQEMMVERKYSELVVGATYFTRNLLIGDWTVIRYEYEIKEIIDLCKDTMCFIGPIPMPK